MLQNRFLDYLFKFNALIQPVLSFIPSVFFGFYVFRIENAMSEGRELFSAVKMVGFTNELIIAVLFLALLFLYHYFIMLKPLKRFEKNKENTINGLLASVTEALFLSYGTHLEVSAMVQVCDYKKEQREVAYQYNTSDMSFEKVGLYFGDVGICCVQNKDFFMKEFSYENWQNEDEEYRRVVPRDLRLILAKPIFDKSHNVIAVLEIDIFENTAESNSGSTKEGFLTEAVTLAELKQILTRRGVKVMFGKWANSIASLILN